MADRAAVRFAGSDPGGLIFETLGVLTACYHRPSGRTHLLMEPSPEILDLLGDRIMDAAAILAALAERFDLDAEDDIAQTLQSRLAELEEAGLVRRIEEDASPSDA